MSAPASAPVSKKIDENAPLIFPQEGKWEGRKVKPRPCCFDGLCMRIVLLFVIQLIGFTSIFLDIIHGGSVKTATLSVALTSICMGITALMCKAILLNDEVKTYKLKYEESERKLAARGLT